MRILIATGIYPPALGGPAKYAYNLKNDWEKMDHKVTVKTFTIEHKLPKGISHIFFFFKIIFAVISCDFVYSLDQSAVGFPATLAAKLFFKKSMIRTGGDRLWEEYVEQTKEKILFKDFYATTRNRWTLKHRLLFNVSKWTMKHVDALIFSTAWQKDIFMHAYNLDPKNIYVLENYYGHKLPYSEPTEKNFIGGTRKLVWKNLDVLEQAFKNTDAKLDLYNYGREEFQKKLSECYATILVSLGDISPNMILESIRYNKPFIITQENGLMDRIGAIAITVNPLDVNDIREKILWLLKKENYDMQVDRIKNFNFTHTWEEIAREVIELYKKL